jgi:predicted nucleic acid-binding protein
MTAKQHMGKLMPDSFMEDVPVAPLDVQAIALGVTLVTNNEADFAIYPGLALENWVSPH